MHVSLSTSVRPVVCVLLTLLAAGPRSQAAEPEVVVRPQAIQDLLPNPGIGWQTFHRSAGDDRSLPDWIPSTVHYARWGWGVLEPAAGRIDEAFLDAELARSRASGQRYAFRAMCCSSTPGKPYHPAWLASAGGKELTCRYDRQRGLRVPDLDDPATLAMHLDFIRRLGARYDGHPDLDHVDLGSLGWWGEWHMSSSDCSMPSSEHQRAIVDAYLAAFTKTPLVMLIGGGDELTYAVAKGTGWRADCLGDMGGFSRTWNHMRHMYPVAYRKSDLDAAWRHAPVCWETCWDMRKWKSEGWPLRTIFNYALALHASQINNKSAPLPAGDDVRPEVERFLRRLGYRYELMELRHPARVAAGDACPIATRWRNVGSAPCYRPYRLAFRLRAADGRGPMWISSADVPAWLPGSVELFSEAFFQNPSDLPPGTPVEVTDRPTLGAALAPGRYALDVALLDPQHDQPALRLAIEGRSPDGWYPLSHLEVVSR